MDKSEDSGDIMPGVDAKPYIDKALELHGGNDSYPMPGGFPVAAGGYLMYRPYNDIAGVAIKDMVDKEGNKIKAGEVVFRTTPMEGSLAVAMNEPGRRTSL